MILTLGLASALLLVVPPSAQPAHADSLGSWIAIAMYPLPFPQGIFHQSCVTSGEYIYCIGGSTGWMGGRCDATDAVYYAPISSSGVGAWTITTSHPTNLPSQCVTSRGYIFCIVGNTSAYYASVSSSGVGAWKSTTMYPGDSSPSSCVESDGYVYCIGTVSAINMDRPASS